MEALSTEGASAPAPWLVLDGLLQRHALGLNANRVDRSIIISSEQTRVKVLTALITGFPFLDQYPMSVGVRIVPRGTDSANGQTARTRSRVAGRRERGPRVAK